MKTLAEFISESINGPWETVTTTDLINYDIWTPNNDLSKNDLKAIVNAFYKKYPANPDGCGEIRGAEIKCEISQVNGKDCVKFTFYWCPMRQDIRAGILSEIVDLITNTIYSVRGGKREIVELMYHLRYEH